MDKGNTYLLFNNHTNLYKIGITNSSPFDRANKIATISGCDVNVVFYTTLNNPKEFESYLHNIYSEKRIFGEWFHLEEDDICEIYNFIIESNFSNFVVVDTKWDEIYFKSKKQ